MMDFKDWKKTGEDSKSVTMAHPKGHSMQILLKGLPAIQREALKRLPLYDGGEIKGVHKEDPDKKGRSLAGKELNNSKLHKHLNHPVSSKIDLEDSKEEHRKVLNEMKEMPNPKLKGLAKGGPSTGGEEIEGDEIPVAASKLESQYGPEEERALAKATPPPAPQAPVVVNVGQPTPMPAPAPAQVPMGKPSMAMPSIPSIPSAAGIQGSVPLNVPQPNVSTSNPNVQLPNGSMSGPGAAQTGIQAAKEQQNIDIAKAQSMVPVEQAKLEAQRQQAVQDQNNINALKTHADNLAANINKIDPDAYRKNMSAPSKVATGLGLFLGGFSVPFGGQNFTADFLNKQIDRDISAQQQNNENQKTIWGAYNSLYNNENLASNMAKASMAEIYTTQAAAIAQKLGTPQAIANYHKLASDLAVIKNKAILDSAGNLSSLPNNPKGISGPVQKEHVGMNNKQEYIPGTPSFGNPSSEAAVPSGQKKPAIEPDDYADTGILKPDAQQKLDSLRYTPKARDEIDQIKAQYGAAQMADRLLNQLHDVHQTLYKDAKTGGSAGYIRRHDPSASIPLIGEALSRTFVQPATANETNKDYDLNRTRIVGDIAAALRGTNISGDEINHIVTANSPEPNDSPELVAKKERAIRLFIKNNINTSLLKDWHLAK